MENVSIFNRYCRHHRCLLPVACDGRSTVDTTVKAHAPGPLLLRSELRSCEKVEVVVLGFPSLISLRFLWT